MTELKIVLEIFHRFKQNCLAYKKYTVYIQFYTKLGEEQGGGKGRLQAGADGAGAGGAAAPDGAAQAEGAVVGQRHRLLVVRCSAPRPPRPCSLCLCLRVSASPCLHVNATYADEQDTGGDTSSPYVRKSACLQFQLDKGNIFLCSASEIGLAHMPRLPPDSLFDGLAFPI